MTTLINRSETCRYNNKTLITPYNLRFYWPLFNLRCVPKPHRNRKSLGSLGLRRGSSTLRRRRRFDGIGLVGGFGRMSRSVNPLESRWRFFRIFPRGIRNLRFLLDFDTPQKNRHPWKITILSDRYAEFLKAPTPKTALLAWCLSISFEILSLEHLEQRYTHIIYVFII